MIVSHKVKFDGIIPKPEAVLDELRKITGLNDIKYIEVGTRKYVLNHPLFDSPIVSLIFDSDTSEVILWTKSLEVNYLIEAGVAALISIGGKYDFKINELAWGKWDEVKDVYKTRIIGNAEM